MNRRGFFARIAVAIAGILGFSVSVKAEPQHQKLPIGAGELIVTDPDGEGPTYMLGVDWLDVWPCAKIQGPFGITNVPIKVTLTDGTRFLVGAQRHPLGYYVTVSNDEVHRTLYAYLHVYRVREML